MLPDDSFPISKFRCIELEYAQPIWMGILNCTPDSFSDGGKYIFLDQAIRHAESLIADGARVIDVGGASSRPFAEPVTVAVECARVLPVIEALARRDYPVVLSVDTFHAEVARAALNAGAEVVNDISALGDEGMAGIVADRQAHVVLMHMQGTPQDMQIAPHYTDVCAEVLAFLQARAAYAEHHGVSQDKIWLDVGIGFGKTSAHNLALLRDMAMWKDVPYPLVMGLSRKRFLGDWINEPCAQERDFATVAACLAVYQQRRRGIIFRVHNVRALEQAFRVWQHFALPCE